MKGVCNYTNPSENCTKQALVHRYPSYIIGFSIIANVVPFSMEGSSKKSMTRGVYQSKTEHIDHDDILTICIYTPERDTEKIYGSICVGL